MLISINSTIGETLVVLSLVIILIMLVAAPESAIQALYSKLWALTGISVVLVFRAPSVFSFYLSFEASLIPIFLLVMA